MIPRTRWARAVDGAYIAYQDFGEGPITLVVIHGWISHLEVYWRDQARGRKLASGGIASRLRLAISEPPWPLAGAQLAEQADRMLASVAREMT